VNAADEEGFCAETPAVSISGSSGGRQSSEHGYDNVEGEQAVDHLAV
jgi:hypothetical protein